MNELVPVASSEQPCLDMCALTPVTRTQRAEPVRRLIQAFVALSGGGIGKLPLQRFERCHGPSHFARLAIPAQALSLRCRAWWRACPGRPDDVSQPSRKLRN